MSGLVGKELEESSKTLASIDPNQIWAIANALVKVFRSGGKLIVFGNGGSAADAQHLAAEFSGTLPDGAGTDERHRADQPVQHHGHRQRLQLRS